MIRGLIDRFAFRLKLWIRARGEDYGGRPRTYFGIFFAALLVFGVGFSVGYLYSEPAHLVVEPQRAKMESLDSGYTLFTWARSGTLRFAFVPQCKRGQFARSWFAKWVGERGITQLEEELSAFPEGTSIEWLDWPSEWVGMKFAYPQKEVTDRIKKRAQSNHLKLTFSGGWLD